jgi:hypothetical protein
MARRSTTAGKAAADPIFRAIAEHRAALAFWQALPGDAAHADIETEASGRESDAVSAVFRVMPTTAAGAGALLKWLTEPEFSEDEHNSRPRFLVIGDLFEDEVKASALQQLRAAAALLAPASGEDC